MRRSRPATGGPGLRTGFANVRALRLVDLGKQGPTVQTCSDYTRAQPGRAAGEEESEGADRGPGVDTCSDYTYPHPDPAADTASTPPVATAEPEPSPHDFAAVAEQLGATVDLRELEIAKLITATLAAGTTTVAVGSQLRLLLADLRRLEGVVRAEQLRGMPEVHAS